MFSDSNLEKLRDELPEGFSIDWHPWRGSGIGGKCVRLCYSGPKLEKLIQKRFGKPLPRTRSLFIEDSNPTSDEYVRSRVLSALEATQSELEQL
ncbi:MAG: hypothetical protein A2312_03810 [Candidatus Staskawiczbacteria bacterium RIFOXYB2_FULL_32_9]|uniref:Uncharacterized protein n=1 Tax=Candidatus Staskawiczbacteria bacterium RIFOXYD1_FULL_32_13 TaxID=1802234 RepID=A0A1G2JPF8_9BACT|nr:MAG: hypothetical protein UR22_C0002G0049 [Parcubacteria group bacterium GW2011_GWC2_32_10]OGZ78399.1 MAG: hypothetical protein A2256_04480 [Candidatus Staskawiczbacteria bacterium RIFOXYA2_FULL_32_7]OGZ78651.1 MAG: hypothetical protein A2360_00455 [Candidatus Staskawiczbacteria bacterium RIFOXYB1_FULL_32_11]OGZ82309.1 MAG: hypothetical protein A2312_03810 [Candidatus Staskawiczbacteria bacterium RIFOXYB2_FULL_32_9]OGZ86890.1 MAG: hypothetical protein A2463_01940 [Candidatus Staskawiczbacter